MEKPRFHSWFALAIVLGLACYQLALCFINTRILPITNSYVAGAEVALLLATLVYVLRRKQLTELALPTCVVAYFLMMYLLRGEVDLQGLRNLLIIYLLFSLGRVTANLRDVNRIVWALSAVVAFFACFEYFRTELYLSLFDILHYYSARGLVSQDQLDYLNTNLWISGMRPVGRIMLPFLGDQRISSLFLEPVSMGNYAVIVCMWGLSFDFSEWRKAVGHLIAGAFFIIASDSRFASLIVLLLVIIRLLPLLQAQWLLYLLPVAVIAGQAYFASLHIADPLMDDFAGRLAKGGNTLLTMKMTEVLGIGNVEELYDMGIPYSLVVFGVLLCLLLWLCFTFLRFETKQGMRMRAMLAVYCMGLLMISGTSFYSSKTACLLWLMLGALAAQKAPTAEAPAALPPTVRTDRVP